MKEMDSFESRDRYGQTFENRDPIRCGEQAGPEPALKSSLWTARSVKFFVRRRLGHVPEPKVCK